MLYYSPSYSPAIGDYVWVGSLATIAVVRERLPNGDYDVALLSLARHTISARDVWGILPPNRVAHTADAAPLPVTDAQMRAIESVL